MAIGPIERAQKLLAKGDKDAAVKILTPIVKGNRDDLEAWWLLANAYTRPEHARFALEQVLRLQPDHREARKLQIRLEPSPIDEYPFPNMLPPSLTKPKAAASQPRSSTLPMLPLGLRVVLITIALFAVLVLAGFAINSFYQQQQMAAAADLVDLAIQAAGEQQYQVTFATMTPSRNNHPPLYCIATTPVTAVASSRRYENVTRFMVGYNERSDSWYVIPGSWAIDCPSPGSFFGR